MSPNRLSIALVATALAALASAGCTSLTEPNEITIAKEQPRPAPKPADAALPKQAAAAAAPAAVAAERGGG